MKLLVTGSSGFLGKRLVNSLVGYDLVAPIRKPTNFSNQSVFTPIVFDLNQIVEGGFFSDVTVCIHVAGKAHSENSNQNDYDLVNTQNTLDLANEAARCGVKRFIFISSIGVNGIESTEPFTCFDTPLPHDTYSISKFNAEKGLAEISKKTGMEFVIIRPPLVYGANAPGNFGKLSNLVEKKIPLPLGAIHNKRSLVALDNLVDLIITCIEHPNAANQIFLVSDDDDLSTTELLQMMTRATGKKPRLLPVPMSWLKLAGKLTGNQAVIDRLCGNLQVDISHTKHTLDWKPPISVEEGIRRCFETSV